MWYKRGEGYFEWVSVIAVVGGGWRRWWQGLGGAVATAGILSFLCTETDFFLFCPALALLEFSFTFFYCYGLSSASHLFPLSILFFLSLKLSPVFLFYFFCSLFLLSKLYFFSTLSVFSFPFSPYFLFCYDRAPQFSKQLPLCFLFVYKPPLSPFSNRSSLLYFLSLSLSTPLCYIFPPYFLFFSLVP